MITFEVPMRAYTRKEAVQIARIMVASTAHCSTDGPMMAGTVEATADEVERNQNERLHLLGEAVCKHIVDGALGRKEKASP